VGKPYHGDFGIFFKKDTNSSFSEILSDILIFD